MKRLISGMQPTANIHLGNYLGALANWVNIQYNYDSLFFVPDLHAITVDYDNKNLKNSVYKIVATYMAAGIDVQHSKIFVQSLIHSHAELAWILSCNIPLGWMQRMTQFKDKSTDREPSLGLLCYPSLMAADILLYKAHFVPTGADQKQHIELTRDIAIMMNRKLGNVFVVPEPIITGENTRIMSLKDASKKMSKSDPSDLSRINIIDDADTILNKIKKAKTDAHPISFENINERPEALNLIKIFAGLSNISTEEVIRQYDGCSFSNFKNNLSDLIISVFCPIRSKILLLMDNEDYLEEIIKSGTERVSHCAKNTINEVYHKIGLRS
jgi:tryptophanyl-tRNA synthetase